MNKVIKKATTGTTHRYIAVGLSVYLFELIVIFVSQKLGAGPLLAVALSFWLGLMLSFLLQKFFTFQDKRMERKILLPQVIAVCVLVLFNFGFTLVVTNVLKNLLPPSLTRTLALGITTLWNFYLYRTRIFNRSQGMLVD